VSNSSTTNKTTIKDKLSKIPGMEDTIFNDDTVYNPQKSSSASRKTLPYYLTLLINTVTLLSISYVFSGMEYTL